MNIETHVLAALAGQIASTMYTGGKSAARAELAQSCVGSFLAPISSR